MKNVFLLTVLATCFVGDSFGFASSRYSNSALRASASNMNRSTVSPKSTGHYVHIHDDFQDRLVQRSQPKSTGISSTKKASRPAPQSHVDLGFDIRPKVSIYNIIDDSRAEVESMMTLHAGAFGQVEGMKILKFYGSCGEAFDMQVQTVRYGNDFFYRIPTSGKGLMCALWSLGLNPNNEIIGEILFKYGFEKGNLDLQAANHDSPGFHDMWKEFAFLLNSDIHVFTYFSATVNVNRPMVIPCDSAMQDGLIQDGSRQIGEKGQIYIYLGPGHYTVLVKLTRVNNDDLYKELSYRAGLYKKLGGVL